MSIFLVTCPAPSLQNGELHYDSSQVFEGYPVETVASFTCHDGFILSGSNSTTCQTSGDWNLETPVCNQSNENGTIYLYQPH